MSPAEPTFARTQHLLAGEFMADLTGKIALVTGASSGIGLETAVELAKQGAHVVCLSRDPDRAVAEIKQRSGSQKVETLPADLSTVAGAKAAAKAFLSKHQQLHILVNNAGACFSERIVTQDGIEKTIALNHMGYFVLTTELLETIKASAPARIVSVSSRGHKRAKLDVNDLAMASGWNIMLAYGNSKLCNILFTKELTRRLQGTGVTATCMHPGGVATNIWTASGHPVAKIIGLLKNILLDTPQEGADTIVWLASSPEAEGQSGGYYIKRKARGTSPEAQDSDLAAKVWAKSAEIAATA